MPKLDLTTELAAPTGVWPRTLRLDELGELSTSNLLTWIRAANQGDHDAYLLLAEEMEERDPHYASVLSTRKRALLGLERKVESASDKRADKKLADAVRALIATPAFAALLPALLDALGKGYSAVEMLWDTARSPWTPRFVWRDPRYFQFDPLTGQELRLRDVSALNDGLPLPPYRFLIHQPRLKMGLPLRGGLARLVAGAFVYGKLALRQWLGYAETYGMPIRVGRYGPAATEADKQDLQAALAELGADAYAVLHEQFKLELLAAPNSASGGELYRSLLAFLQELVSKAVLGRSDAADATSGKLGNAQDSMQVRQDILESDAAELAATLNAQLIQPFIDLNFGPPAAYPVFAFHFPEVEDKTLLLQLLRDQVPLGLKVEQSIIRDKFNLPDPDEGAELLGNAPAPSPAPVPPAINRALNRAAGSAHEDPTAPLVERLGAEAEPLLNALLEPVRAALQDSADLMDFREKLLTLYPELDAKAFAALMGQALAVADAAGYWEAQDGG